MTNEQRHSPERRAQFLRVVAEQQYRTQRRLREKQHRVHSTGKAAERHAYVVNEIAKRLRREAEAVETVRRLMEAVEQIVFESVDECPCDLCQGTDLAELDRQLEEEEEEADDETA